MPGFSITMFTLRHRLPPGKLTTFDIVATDKGGLEASDSFNVVYVVPFFRTPLGIGAVGAVLASLAMGGWVVRVQRRNRLLKRRFNPYIAGAPILQNERFFGRDRLLNRVLQTVHNNSILLYGERRIGKTSFQHQLKRRLTALDDPDYQFFPVFVDLQGTPQEKFFSHIAEEVFEELEP
ncbi:MAG: ATP-binding protein, partial [Gammaproteobacteria bacterium]|nr:ATP-binding protein [Gammaproteobacteria bacterium]